MSIPPYPLQPLSSNLFVSTGSATQSTGVPVPYPVNGILEAVTIPGTLRGATGNTAETAARAWWFPTLASVTVNVSYTGLPEDWPLNSPSLAVMFAIGVIPIPTGNALTWYDVFQEYCVGGGVQPQNQYALNPQLMTSNKNPPLLKTGYAYINSTGIATPIVLTSSLIDPTGGTTISQNVCGNWPFSGTDPSEISGGAMQQQYLANCPMYSMPASFAADTGDVGQCIRNQLFYYLWVDNSDPNFALILPNLQVNLLVNLFGQAISYPVTFPTGFEYPPYIITPPLPL